MCQNKVSIAKLVKHRHITVCEHAIVQVQWDNLTLSFGIKDFQNFGDLVKQNLQSENLPEPTVILRVNRVMAGWPTADFYKFADMVLIGLINLDSGLAYLARKRLAMPDRQKEPTLYLN